MKRYKDQDPKTVILQTIRSILPEKDYQLYLFGSRADNTERYNSDRDILIKGDEKIPIRTWGNLQDQIGELPYPVDLVDYHSSDQEFLDLIKNDLVKI